MAAAKRFFSKATKQHGAPRVITLQTFFLAQRGYCVTLAPAIKAFDSATVETKEVEEE